MKIKAVSYRESELLDSYRESLKNVGVYLEISFGLFDHKIIPGLSRTLFKFQDFPGLVGTIILYTGIYPSS